MPLKKTKKGAILIGISTVGLSATSSVLGGVGASTSNATAQGIAASGQQSLQNISSFLPVAGTALGGAGALSSLKLLGIKKNKRRF